MGLLVLLAWAGLIVVGLLTCSSARQAVGAWSAGSVRRRAILVCAAGVLLVIVEASAFAVDDTYRASGASRGGPGTIVGLGVLTILIGLHALATGSWTGPDLPTPLRVLYLLVYLLCGATAAIVAFVLLSASLAA